MALQPLKGLSLLIVSVALSLCTLLQVLDYSIANVSIPYIAGGLGISDNDGTWVITMFAVGNAIALPMTGWLTNRFGSVKLLTASTLLFTFFSWVCGAAFTFEMLVVSRFIQGFVAGPLIPLGQSVLLQCFPNGKKSLSLAIWNVVALVGPIMGPILGGWITQDYSWRWIFYINIPIGILCAFLIWHYLIRYETEKIKIKADWLGFFLLAIGIGALQIMLDKGQQYDWFRSPVIRTLAVTSSVSLIYLIVWQFTCKNPLMELRLFKDRNFAIGTFLTAISYMILFGVIVITPLWLQDYMGYTPLWAGLAISTIGIFPLLTVYFVAKIMPRVNLKYLITICFLIFALSLFYFTNFTTDVSFGHVAYTRFLFGIGISFYLAPLITLSIAKIPQEKLSSASGLFHFFRIFAGGAGTSLFVTLWQRRAIHHHFNLGESVNMLNENTRQMLTDLHHFHLKGKAALTMFNNILDQQAYILATNDVFWISAWVYVGISLLIFFFKKRTKEEREKALSGGGK